MHRSRKSQATSVTVPMWTTAVRIVGFIELDAALRVDEDGSVGSEVVEDHALVIVHLYLRLLRLSTILRFLR